MARFDLQRDRVDWTLYAVYWLQTGWTLGLGVILAVTPRRRLGNSYQFILAVPHGEHIIAALYLVTGLVLTYSMLRGRQELMTRALTVGGLGSWLFGCLLLTGAISSPTGAVGWWFCLYVGAHMLLQSTLLRRTRAAP